MGGGKAAQTISGSCSGIACLRSRSLSAVAGTVTFTFTSSHLMGQPASQPIQPHASVIYCAYVRAIGRDTYHRPPLLLHRGTYIYRYLARQVLRRYRYQALQQDGSLFRTSQKRVLRRLSYLSPQLTKELLFRQPLPAPAGRSLPPGLSHFPNSPFGRELCFKIRRTLRRCSPALCRNPGLGVLASPVPGLDFPGPAFPASCCIAALLLHTPPILSFPYRSLSFPHSLDIFSDIPTLGNFDAQPTVNRPPARCPPERGPRTPVHPRTASPARRVSNATALALSETRGTHGRDSHACRLCPTAPA